MEKLVSKITMVSFVCAAFMMYYTVNVMISLLENSFSVVARFVESEAVRHGLPLGAAILFFFYLSFSPKIRQWAQEVIIEVSKVVWPSKKETTGMTIVVTFIMVLSGVILWVMDFFSSNLIYMIINYNEYI